VSLGTVHISSTHGVLYWGRNADSMW
jgi:hypothetical protein